MGHRLLTGILHEISSSNSAGVRTKWRESVGQGSLVV
jgi:hypothetical protein